LKQSEGVKEITSLDIRWVSERGYRVKINKREGNNMKQITKLAVLLALGITTSMINAQDEGGPRQRGPHGPGPGGRGNPIVAVLDVNKDGVIDAGELANAGTALLKKDANGDGQLTMEELRPTPPEGAGEDRGPRPGRPPGAGEGQRPEGRGVRPEREGQRPPAPPVIAVLDADKDGVLSQGELTGAAAALATLDKDGDGQLTPQELRPMPQGGEGERRGPGPRGGKPPGERR
jgi:hypothetical protein